MSIHGIFWTNATITWTAAIALNMLLMIKAPMHYGRDQREYLKYIHVYVRTSQCYCAVSLQASCTQVWSSSLCISVIPTLLGDAGVTSDGSYVACWLIGRAQLLFYVPLTLCLVLSMSTVVYVIWALPRMPSLGSRTMYLVTRRYVYFRIVFRLCD
jgi:hypothetical protein